MAETDAAVEVDGNRTTVEYDGPAGGWGSLKGIAQIFGKEWDTPATLETLMRQNKPKGFMSVSCSWAKPADHHTFEFCENGAKATLWELTTLRCTPDFFAKHTVTELRDWSDYDLEQRGRLTHPMRYDAESDHYVPCEWEEAFEGIGQHLRSFDPKSVIFYSSGRASLETSYLYALFGRLYGNNNLPDSSNMCHETTGVALKKSIGVGVGTAVFDDLAKCDAMFFFGQNPGSNSPRFLHLAGSGQARRTDHYVQSGPRKRPGGFRQSSKSHRDADRQGNRDQQPIPSGQGRRRHRGHTGHLQACLCRRRYSQNKWQQAHPRYGIHRASHQRP
jgi:anaerobic selenocysteine-containing dehydrogenase